MQVDQVHFGGALEHLRCRMEKILLEKYGSPRAVEHEVNDTLNAIKAACAGREIAAVYLAAGQMVVAYVREFVEVADA